MSFHDEAARRWTRRGALGLIGAAGAGHAFGGARAASEPPSSVTADDDFDELWSTLDQRYCYFGEKRTDWAKVRDVYRPQAVAAPDLDTFRLVLCQILAELYDAHTHVRGVPDGAPRFPPFDLVVAADGEAARIVAIQDGSAAAVAGLAIGERIVGVDGLGLRAEVARRMPKCLTGPDPAADAYAVNAAVTGYSGKPRRLVVEGASGRRELLLPLTDRSQLPDVESRALPGGVGYIAIRTFAGSAIASSFDAALARLREAPGLILDVRDNGGGDTAVARPIMGRFIRERRPYAFMRRRQDRGLSARWTEYVDPQGPFTYDNPVVVLTNRWSGSMAEGFPMGMRDIGAAHVVGTPMMGLGAGVFDLRLDLTGTDAQYSAEPVYDTQDRARARFVPDVVVPDGADILAAGQQELQRMIAAAASPRPNPDTAARAHP